jgi:hypothetical protein
VRVRPTVLLFAVIAAGTLAVTHSLRSFAPTAEAVSRSEQNASEQKRSRNAVREQPPGQRPGAVDHPPIEQPTASPETWSEAEILGALQECTELLSPLDAAFELTKPIRAGQCGAPAPVLLRRVAGVEITPPTIVNCRLAAKLHEWIVSKLQPLSHDVLGAPISRIVSASGYSCRQRLGSASARQSEHSFANAFDVRAFVTSDGRTVDVLTGWGPTARDLIAQAQVPDGARRTGGDARPLTHAQPAPASEFLIFLRKVHETACGSFSTVLGPEANEAHRDHLHFDLAQRRSTALCE